MGSISGIAQRQEYSTENLDDNLLSICKVLDECTSVDFGKWCRCWQEYEVDNVSRL